MLLKDILPLIGQSNAVCITGYWEGLPRLYVGWAPDTTPELLDYPISRIGAGELYNKPTVFIMIDRKKT